MNKKKYLEEIERVIQEGEFKDDWDSLSKYTTPKWYINAKFGIFIHWGVYSVPAFNNEWYPRNMYIQGSEEFKHHIAT
ncbi:MAG: alpha-L-fucosidase, partial [Caldicoprobacterales bacterium]